MPTSDVRVWDGTTWVSLRGPTGNTGAPGTPATVSVKSVTALAAGATPTVTDSNTDPSVCELNFGIPAGAAGTAATVAVGTVTAGAAPAVTNSGSATAAVLNFTLQKGDKGDTGAAAVIKGTATTYPPIGSPAVNDLYILGTAGSLTGAPASGVGPAAIGDGVVWTGAAWVNVGPLRGPQGVKGDTGASGTNATVSVGTVTTGAAGTNAVVTDGDAANPNNVVLNMTIPQGAKGDPGRNYEVYTNAAGTPPSPLGAGAIWLVP